MIEEKDVLALVNFKAQIDDPSGTTFLRCTDSVFSTVFKNGTVATALLKNKAKFSDTVILLAAIDLLPGVVSFKEPIKNLCYSKALMMVKKGYRIYRENWNSSNQWIRYIDPYAPHPDTVQGCLNIDTTTLNPYFKAADNNELAEGTMMPYLAIKTNNNQLVPWLPTQTDNLAEDWVVLPK